MAGLGGATSGVHVMYTPNGGRDWYEQGVPTKFIERLMAIDMVNMTHGWSVGTDGTILRTTRGTSLESRLWNGMTDPVFISNALVGLMTVALLGTGFFLCRRPLRRRMLGDSSERRNRCDDSANRRSTENSSGDPARILAVLSPRVE